MSILEGKRFGRLLTVASAPPLGKRPRWLCLCDCGKETTVLANSLQQGNTKSCGCLKRESRLGGSKALTRHGEGGKTKSSLYRTWASMKNRCSNPNNPNYHHYGSRGITVCDRWLHSFENFKADMGVKPHGTSIDRIDVNGNYEPSNCRWATASQQNANRRPYKWRKNA